VASWHQTVPQSRPDEASRLANTLTRELEVERLLGNLPERVRRLTVIPDDALHGFPFSVLKIEGRFLFERFCVSVGFQPEGPAQLFRQLQAVGEPLLVGITKGSPPLPKTLPQIQLLETWFAARRMPTTTLLDENVTPQKLEEKLQASGLLHLSCHGEFSPDNAEQTGWQLLRPEGDTQIFGLSQLSRLNLRRMRHATLLSCWGADNYVLPGRWIVSLPETLWRAGTGSVVACLWQVSEDYALQFAQHFYAALPGRRTDEALREAQYALMRQASDLSGDAVDWAGFQHYGSPQHLRV
jgi:CHAT domain-containing protein